MTPVVVGRADEAERAAACRWLYADGRAARCADLLAAGDLDPAGLFVARSPAVCGAALVESLPGGVGLAWAVRATSAGVEDALAAAACGWLRGRGVAACQAFAAADELPALAPLVRAGFRRVTRLVQMRRDPAPLPPESSRLDVRPVEPRDRDEFARTLLATYTDSLDCPELNVVRSAADALAGVRRGGVAPEWWLLARHDGRPAGVVAFGDDPAPGVVELAYFGLVPEARGRGLGGELLWHALAAAGVAVQLSVDARNGPALRLYRRFGFAERDRREAFLAVWDDS
jgi:GNAT superfamily N-acetyltransferase